MSVELPKKIDSKPVETSKPKETEKTNQLLQTTNALENLASETESELKTKPQVEELKSKLGDGKTNILGLKNFVEKNPEAKDIPENQKEILDIFAGWHLYGSLIKSILNSKKTEYKVLKTDGTINIERIKAIVSTLETEYEGKYQQFQIADFDKFCSQKIGGVNVFDPVENSLVQTLDKTKNGDNIYKKYIFENRQKYRDEMYKFLEAYNGYVSEKNKGAQNGNNDSSSQNSTDKTTNAGEKNPSLQNSAPTYSNNGENIPNQTKQDIQNFFAQNGGKLALGGLGILGLYMIFRKKNKDTSEQSGTQENQTEKKGSLWSTILKLGGLGAAGIFAYKYFSNKMGNNNSAPDTPTTDAEAQKSIGDFMKLPEATRKQYDEIGKNIDNFFDLRLPKTQLDGLWLGNFSNSYDDQTFPGYITYLSSGKNVDQTLKAQETIKKLIDAKSTGSEFFDSITKGNFDLKNLTNLASIYAISKIKQNGAQDFDQFYKNNKDKPILSNVIGFLNNILNGKQISQEELNNFFQGELKNNPNFYKEFSSIILGQYIKTQKYFLDKENGFLYEKIKSNISPDTIVGNGKKFSECTQQEKMFFIDQILKKYNSGAEIDANTKTILDKSKKQFEEAKIVGNDSFEKLLSSEQLSNNSEYDKYLIQKDKLQFSQINSKLEKIVGDKNIFETKNFSSSEVKSVLNRFEYNLSTANSNAVKKLLGFGSYFVGGTDQIEKEILQKFKNPEVEKIQKQIGNLKAKNSYTQDDLKNLQGLLGEYANIEKQSLMLEEVVGWSIDQTDESGKFSMKISLATNHYIGAWKTALEGIKDMTIDGNISQGFMKITSLSFGDKVSIITPILVPIIGLKTLRFLTSPTKLAKFGILTAGKLAYKIAPEIFEKTALKFLGKKLGQKVITKLGTKAAIGLVPFGGRILTGLFLVGDILLDRQGRADMGNMIKDFGSNMRDKATGWDNNYKDGLDRYQTFSNQLFNDLTNQNPNKQKIQLSALHDAWNDMGEKNRKIIIQSTGLSLITMALAGDENFQKDPNQEKILDQIKKGLSIEGIQKDGSGAKLVLKNQTAYDGVIQKAFNEWYNPFIAFNSGKVQVA